jgi:monoamine oxidase
VNDRDNRCDVVVIGAGAAGLMAARDLSRAGYNVRVLEARDRIGGRLLEVNDPRALAPIELGAEFVHGRPEATYALLREIGAAVVDNGDATFTARDGPLRPMEEDPFAAASDVLERALERSEDESVEAAIARAARAGTVSPAVAEWTRRLVAGFDAADPRRASARGIAAEWTGEAAAGGAQGRPVGGYGPLVAHLTGSLAPERVALAMQTIVQRIAYDEAGVTVFTRGLRGAMAVRARRAIVTVPIGVLQAAAGEEGAIEFEPPLPTATQRAIALIASGPVLKVVLRFRTAFWERLGDGAFRDAAFVMADGAFPTFWTQAPVRANTLVAWAGGTAADALHALTRERCIALALECAARAFGDPQSAYEAFENGYVHDWQRDPFARGAYSYVTVGGEDARERLAEPVSDTLFFAGEATATDGEGGTVAGALVSGARAAASVRKAALTASRAPAAPSPADDRSPSQTAEGFPSRSTRRQG